ncbi:hypothetical protein INR49_025711 [Caranx melampygus]|nr:hypothetical protein INR49_025711 [Caranx melampygus]
MSSKGKDRPDANVNANATLLRNMKEMIDDMRSDILNKFETTISTAVKREIVAALGPFENRLASYEGEDTNEERDKHRERKSEETRSMY